MSFQHYFTIEGFSGAITATNQAEVIKNAVEIYYEGIITNDSEKANIECYVNTEEKPFILLPKEKLEFEFMVTNIILKNLSTTDTTTYRVFLKRRVEKYIAIV